jgi:hypothetical protein
MSDFLLGVLVALGVFAILAAAAFVLLRRWFERASHRAADHMGRVLAELSGRAAATPLGRRAGAATYAAATGFTNFGAYAASQGISEDQARREFADSIERIARLMDDAIEVPILGRVGLDAVLGLFPVAGDATSAAVSLMLIARSIKYGVPRDIIARMLANVLVDLLLGWAAFRLQETSQTSGSAPTRATWRCCANIWATRRAARLTSRRRRCPDVVPL